MFLSLAGDGRDGFWTRHPMLGALVAGGLLFAAGALVVERFMQGRNARRWAAVSTAADRDFGHVIDEALKAMWKAHSDPDPAGREQQASEWTPAGRADRIRPGASAAGSYHGAAPAVVRADLPDPDYEGAALTPVTRLEMLLHDQAFVFFARKVIAQHRDEVRESVKGWAALMMWAEHSQNLLNHLSVFAEVHLSDVEYYLAWWTPENADHHARKAAQLWSLADVKGRVLLNTLWGSNTAYSFALPDEAAGVSLSEAFRHADTVGRWRPPPDSPLSEQEYKQANRSRLRRAVGR